MKAWHIAPVVVVAGIVAANARRAREGDAPHEARSTELPTPSRNTAPPAHRRGRSAGARPRSTELGGGAVRIEPPPPPTEERVLRYMDDAVIVRMPRNEERELLDSLDEAVIVEHTDGTWGVYAPEDWPDDGPGKIVGRKLPDGKIGWYAGPDAGPRSDPNAFRPLNTSGHVWRAADGTVMIDDEPADDCMFGGKCAH